MDSTICRWKLIKYLKILNSIVGLQLKFSEDLCKQLFSKYSCMKLIWFEQLLVYIVKFTLQLKQCGQYTQHNYFAVYLVAITANGIQREL